MAYPQKTFSESDIHPNSLIGQRRQAVSSNTLLYQLDVLKETGRYDAFKLKWHPSYSDPPNIWPVPNHLFWDSDVGKWIEGACYLLKQQPNEKADTAIKELVDMIRSAQQPDGYLNIHFTVVEPTKRFTNLRDLHELYNAGHLIEAALAHQDLYKNDLLMEPMLKYVDLLCETFGPKGNQLHGYPGHPEIELALLRLYDHTRDKKHFDLAQYFITERGNPKGWYGRHYYDVESERRGDDPNKPPQYYPERRAYWYNQAHKPIGEQETIEGHSVRAMYLLTAVADLVRLEGPSNNSKMNSAINRLWNNMVNQKMYVTGGIGAVKQWEGFGKDYFLPQGTDEGGCYAETCAAIGIMMFAQRLLQIDLNRKYGDIMELCLYNAVLTSMSSDGKKFTYDNQLASSDTNPSQREEWFTCACCPPNVLRVLGMIGGYIWSHKANTSNDTAEIAVHLYIPSTLKFEVGGNNVELKQESDWPWNGDIKFSLSSSSSKVGIKLRVPGWASSFKLSPECPNAAVTNGYLDLPADWLKSNPTFTLSIPLEPRLISSHPYTNQNTVSLARGPVIYCVEDQDNEWVQDHFKTVRLNSNCKINEKQVTDKDSGDRFVTLSVTEGASTIDLEKINASPSTDTKALDSALQHSKPISELKFVPYYFRANRKGRGQMRVGLKRADGSSSGKAN